jgi:hypothetical protein
MSVERRVLCMNHETRINRTKLQTTPPSKSENLLRLLKNPLPHLPLDQLARM